MNFYHGTDPKNVKSIISEGFRLPIYWDEEDGTRWAKEGCLGVGVYVSKSWQTALWFGRALLKVELIQGTRILDVSEGPDSRVINSLKREFGKTLLSPDMVFHKIIPRNKQLTLSELIELTKYHFHRTWGLCSKDGRFHGQSLHQCWSMLRRYKYDGFGHQLSDIGIMLLSPEKVEIRELIAVVRPRPYDRGDREFDSINDLRIYFQKNGETEHLKLAEQIAAADG